MMDRVAFAPSRTIEDDRLIPPRGPIAGYPGITLFYAPRHSHSIVLKHRNALIFMRKSFLLTVLNPTVSPSNFFAFDFQREICTIQILRGFDNYRYRSVDFGAPLGQR